MTRVRAGVVTLAAFALLAASSLAAAAQDTGGWVRLLVAGPGPVTSIELGPAWPNDRLILARREGRLLRSTDGGGAWVDLGAPPAESLTIARVGDTRVVVGTGLDGVHRSTDDGESWELVLPVSARFAPFLDRSPRFASIGRALVRADDRLYLTTDAAATWTQVEPVPGQRVSSAGFWSESGPERDLYAVVAGTTYASEGRLYRGGEGGWELVEPIEGRLVDRVLFSQGGTVVLILAAGSSDGAPPAVISSDNGDSWSPFAANLAVGDTPYRLSANLLSPDIANGGAIFVTGVGGEPARPALFRSDDRGVTWTHLASTPLLQSGERLRVDRSLDVSPNFAVDRTAFLVQNSSAGSPSSGACSVHRTTDGGATWAQISSEQRVSCYLSAQMGPTGATWFSTSSTPGGTFRSYSTDGGANWTRVSIGMSTVETLTTSPSFEQDGALFAGTRTGEIWARGPELVATDGQVGCLIEPVAGFGRIWSTEPNMRQRLGCPQGPEQSVQIRDRRHGDSRGLWLEDDRDDWYDLSLRGDPRPYGKRSKARSDDFWQAGPDRVVGGAVQEFAGGTLIFLPEEDGRRMIIFLDGRVYWREFPD